MRRALGFSLTTFGIRLDSFITWLESTGDTVITSDAAIAWATATRSGSTDPAYLARRLDVARIFARHMQVLDPATEIPPMDVLSRRYRRITPHLYPPGEIAAILAAAGELSPPLRAATWQTLLALLAATGMRVSEACRLDRGDAGLDAGVLTIRDSKFGKSRDIPVHPTAVTALRGYEQVRDRLCPAPVTTAFFVSTRGTRIDSHNMPNTFARPGGSRRDHPGRRPAQGKNSRHPPHVHRHDAAGLAPRRRRRPGPAAAAVGLPRPRRPQVVVLVHDRLARAAGPGRRPALARLRRTAVNSSDLPALLQGFFTGKLVIQRQASPATVASYRDTFTLLLAFAAARAGRQPHQLQITDLDAETVGAFLTHLEKERGSSIPTRNARLAAIRSFFRYAALHDPQHAQLIAQVLAIPAKRAGKATVTWLTGPETEALTAAPDRNTLARPA